MRKVLVGNKGRIEIRGEKCKAKFLDGSIMYFPLDELPEMIKELEIMSTDDGDIKLSTWENFGK